jgi:hypothetical protein
MGVQVQKEPFLVHTILKHTHPCNTIHTLLTTGGGAATSHAKPARSFQQAAGQGQNFGGEAQVTAAGLRGAPARVCVRVCVCVCVRTQICYYSSIGYTFPLPTTNIAPP